eukprot:3957044-Alexandrium_andersonii.AAC.1
MPAWVTHGLLFLASRFSHGVPLVANASSGSLVLSRISRGVPLVAMHPEAHRCRTVFERSMHIIRTRGCRPPRKERSCLSGSGGDAMRSIAYPWRAPGVDMRLRRGSTVRRGSR